VFADAASVVTGGTGATFLAYPSVSPPGIACGKKPDGAAFVAGAVHMLPGNLAGSGATPLGGAFTLSFNVPGPFAALFFSTAVGTPALIPGAGYSYLASPLLIGSAELVGAYRRAFEQFGLACRTADGESCALKGLEIAHAKLG
jgi:hypothetical protein